MKYPLIKLVHSCRTLSFIWYGFVEHSPTPTLPILRPKLMSAEPLLPLAWGGVWPTPDIYHSNRPFTVARIAEDSSFS